MMKLLYLVVLVYSLQTVFSAAPCRDLIPKRTCDSYKRAGYCTRSWYVKAKCRSTCNICGTSGSTTTAPRTTSATCKNRYPKRTCDYYKRKGYCRTSNTIKEGCRLTCNLCGGSGTTSPPVDCRDLITAKACIGYKNRKLCNHPYVKDKCKKTCNLCGTGGTTKQPGTPAICRDRISSSSCIGYKKQGICNTAFVKANCKKTCNFCGTDGTTKQPVTVTTKPTTVNTQTYPTQAPGSCGTSIVKAGRVIAGEDAKDGQWPWQIAMYKNGRFSCGGSLITPQWIVTAAHCLQRTSASSVTVVLGDLDRGTSSGHEQKIQVSKIINHPRYGRLNYDIALMKLSKPARLNDHVRTVCLPKQGEHIQVGSKCFISGWGKTKHPGGSVQKLQHASLTIISKSACSRTNSKVVPISDQMVCAKNAVGRQSGCHGDSGGPFVCRDKSGAWTLHGAVSWGSRYCDINDSATVFSRVSELRQWIDTTMSRN